MQFRASIANGLWAVSNVPAYWRFRQALGEPRRVQRGKLLHILQQNKNTAFGKAHQFEKIDGYEEFTRRVPLSDYTALAPWIDRIQKGETNLVTREKVTHLVPTSGSTGARKLIPFTAGLQGEFNAALAAWLTDLIGQCPQITGGPAYWSITPALGDHAFEKSAVPIGFEADTEYLGKMRRSLAMAVMAVPSGLGRTKSLESFQRQTLFH